MVNFGDPIIFGFALLNSLMALSLYLTFACGLFSFAQIGFIAVGAYTTGIGITKYEIGALAATFLALGVALVLALIVAIPMLRLRDIYLNLLTFGFAEIIVVVARNATDLTGGASGMAIPRSVDNSILLVILVIVVALIWRWRSSLYGQAVEGIRQDEFAAEALAIGSRKYMIGLFIVSSLLAALAGSLYAQHTYFISPNDFGFAFILNLFLFVVVGGVYKWYGALFGAFTLTYVMQWMTPLVEWRPVVLGTLLTVSIIVAPGGVVSLPFREYARGAVAALRGEGRRGGPGPEPGTLAN